MNGPVFHGWETHRNGWEDSYAVFYKLRCEQEFVEYFPQGEKGLGLQAGNRKKVPACTTLRNHYSNVCL